MTSWERATKYVDLIHPHYITVTSFTPYSAEPVAEGKGNEKEKNADKEE